MQEFLKSTYKRFMFAILFFIIIMITYNFVNGTWNLIIGYANSTFIAGLSLILIGLLNLVIKWGGLDIFSFAFKRKIKENGRREDLYDYSERMKEERSKKLFTGIPEFIIGGILFIISIFLSYAI